GPEAEATISRRPSDRSAKGAAMKPLCLLKDRRHAGTTTVGLAWILPLLIAAGCSSIPPPREQLAVSRAAVERALPSGVEAPAELATAREKLERANLAMARRDYEGARFLAEEAEADANLAEARARAVRSSVALAEIRDGIRMLREEMARRRG